MIDAWGKIPDSGLLSGHTSSPGDFHECLQIRGTYKDRESSEMKPLKGSYCGTYIFPLPPNDTTTEMPPTTTDKYTNSLGRGNLRQSVSPAELLVRQLF